MNAHETEIYRLATLLGTEKSIRAYEPNDLETVQFIINNYEPKLEWKVIPPDESEVPYLRKAWHEVRVQVGAKKFGGRHYVHEGPESYTRGATIGAKHKLRNHLGRALVSWLEGEPDEG